MASRKPVPPTADGLEAKVLAALDEGRRQHLVRDDLQRFVLLAAKKEDPSFTWRKLRRYRAALTARRALGRLTEDSSESLLNLDDIPVTWGISKKDNSSIQATPLGILIPWALVNKLKKDFADGLR